MKLMATVLKPYLIYAYATLVRAGKIALSAEEATEGQKVVPEAYAEKVAEYLIEKFGA